MKCRGKGVACMYYPVGFTSSPNPGAAFVKINQDGSVIVITGAQDIGQGSNTALAQIAAEEIGASLSKVSIITGDTHLTPVDAGTAASRVTYVVGNAVKRASAQAKQMLYEVAAAEMGVSSEGLQSSDDKIWLRGFPEEYRLISDIAALAECKRGRPIMGIGVYDPSTTPLNSVTGHGKPYETFIYAAQIAEVEVDTQTGVVDVLKIYAVHDCGKAINPMMVEGQIEGGVAMGIGYGLTENLIFENGRVLNPQLANYILPTSMDVPSIDCVIIEGSETSGPFGAKGIGEPSLLPTAPAIMNAIFDAVGVRIRDLPATPQRVLKALKEKSQLEAPC